MHQTNVITITNMRFISSGDASWFLNIYDTSIGCLLHGKRPTLQDNYITSTTLLPNGGPQTLLNITHAQARTL
jgi:hypothetical protein